MNKILIALSLCVFMSPTALAAHHNGGHAKHNKEQMMKHGQVYTQNAVHIMEAGNHLIQKGSSKKDAKLMLKGAKLYFKGFSMHRHSMHGMKDHLHKMKHDLMHAKVGDTKMSASEMNKIEVTMKGLKSFIKNHKKATHAQMRHRGHNANLLVMMGNTLVKEGKTSLDPEKLKTGVKLLEMGMKFHMKPGHHGKHGKHGSKMKMKRIMKSGHGKHIEKEIEIIKH